MIRIKYCPRCRSSDINCPACGEPVRALRAAQLTYPECTWCHQPTVPYYSPTVASLRHGSPGLFYVACPVRVEGTSGLFDSIWQHTQEHVPLPDTVGMRRIAIKLDAESKEALG